MTAQQAYQFVLDFLFSLGIPVLCCSLAALIIVWSVMKREFMTKRWERKAAERYARGLKAIHYDNMHTRRPGK